ncbi:MAG: hypothetical protein HYU27_05315 [Acidobacteria bacterium]|nr:hypothetical protein [Acidobacteriota bacterium]
MISKFGWRLWDYSSPVSGDGRPTVLARARDASGDVQPLVQEWNPSGYLWNVVARVDTAEEPISSPIVPPPAGFRETCLLCHG